jgi:hypothetical protein
MKEMTTPGYFSAGHLLIADGTDVVEGLQVLGGGIGQGVDFGNGSSSLDECLPA